MKKPILIAVLSLAGAAVTPESSRAQEARSDLFSQQPGRYQIVFNPQIRADTFMIDTATGRVWQLTKYVFLNGEPMVWSLMAKTDGQADQLELVDRFGRKPEASSADTPAATPAKRGTKSQ